MLFDLVNRIELWFVEVGKSSFSIFSPVLLSFCFVLLTSAFTQRITTFVSINEFEFRWIDFVFLNSFLKGFFVLEEKRQFWFRKKNDLISTFWIINQIGFCIDLICLIFNWFVTKKNSRKYVKHVNWKWNECREWFNLQMKI